MSEIRTLTQNINGTETEIAPRTFASAVTDSNGKTLEEIVNSDYELIEEITLTEDTSQIIRTNYNYQSILIHTESILPSVSGGVNIFLNDVQVNTMADCYTANDRKWAECLNVIIGGKIFGIRKNSSYSSGVAIATISSTPNGMGRISASVFTNLTIQSITSVAMPSGMVIKIYAK